MKRNRCDESVGAFRDKRRDFKNLSDQKYSEYLIGLTDELKTKPKRFWSFLKSVKGGRKALSTLVDGHVEVVDDIERADLLNRTFAAKFTDPSVDRLPDAPVYDLPPLAKFHCDIDTVRTILRDVTVNKACGPDGISARIVRECAEELAMPLVVLFNASLVAGHISETVEAGKCGSHPQKGQREGPPKLSISVTHVIVW